MYTVLSHHCSEKCKKKNKLNRENQPKCNERHVHTGITQGRAKPRKVVRVTSAFKYMFVHSLTYAITVGVGVKKVPNLRSQSHRENAMKIRKRMKRISFLMLCLYFLLLIFTKQIAFDDAYGEILLVNFFES